MLIEVKPSTNRWGGLVNSVAVDPENPDVVFIDTGRGGIFASRDGGRTWAHVEGFPTQMVKVVSFSQRNPDILIATSSNDTQTRTNGGIRRNTDGDETWATPPRSTPPETDTCHERASAGGSSRVPKPHNESRRRASYRLAPRFARLLNTNRQ